MIKNEKKERKEKNRFVSGCFEISNNKNKTNTPAMRNTASKGKLYILAQEQAKKYTRIQKKKKKTITTK